MAPKCASRSGRLGSMPRRRARRRIDECLSAVARRRRAGRGGLQPAGRPLASTARHCSRKNSGDTIMTAPATAPDLILHRGLFTTLDRANPTASAVAITDGKFTAVGRDHEVIPLAGEHTRIIDLKGKRVLPGLIDNHLHVIRGGLTF